MDIGAGFKDIAPDLERYVVEFAFGDIYKRVGVKPYAFRLGDVSPNDLVFEYILG